MMTKTKFDCDTYFRGQFFKLTTWSIFQGCEILTALKNFPILRGLKAFQQWYRNPREVSEKESERRPIPSPTMPT